MSDKSEDILANIIVPSKEVGEWTHGDVLGVDVVNKTINTEGGADFNQRLVEMAVTKWGARGEDRYNEYEPGAQSADVFFSLRRAEEAGIDISDVKGEMSANLDMLSLMIDIQAASKAAVGPNHPFVKNLVSTAHSLVRNGMGNVENTGKLFQKMGLVAERMGLHNSTRYCERLEHTGEADWKARNVAYYLSRLDNGVPQDLEELDSRRKEAEEAEEELKESAKVKNQQKGEPKLSDYNEAKVEGADPHPVKSVDDEYPDSREPKINPITRLSSRWGTMVIPKIPRSKSLRASTLRIKPGDSGTPRQVHRILTDGLAFVDMGKKLKGSVLIDCSGSMAPDPGLIEEIIHLSSATVVACYSGYGEEMFRRDVENNVIVPNPKRDCDDHGPLLVVGKDGYCHHDIQNLLRLYFNGWNLVDGPALRWLSHQTGPRIWVSDGWATGIDDQVSTDLIDETRRICARNNILRVDRLVEAVKFFRDRR